MTQRVIEITSPVFLAPSDLPKVDSFGGLFKHKRPLALEIGCGTGDFIAQRARQHPDVNFIAIDIYNKGCLKTCKRVERYNLNNVRVIRVEARYLLSCFAPGETLHAVYINCPDPWPKKRHRRRRLVSERFLIQLAHFLEPGGELFFSTDVEDYAVEVAMTLEGMPHFVNRLHAPITYTLADYPTSRYMRRFKEQGLPVHYIHRQRNPEFDLTREHMPELELSFRCRRELASNTPESQLCSNI